MCEPAKCPQCGTGIARFHSRGGRPFKYCSPKCDKIAMSERMIAKAKAPRIKRPREDRNPPDIEWRDKLLTALSLYRDFCSRGLGMSFEEWLEGAISLHRRKSCE